MRSPWLPWARRHWEPGMAARGSGPVRRLLAGSATALMAVGLGIAPGGRAGADPDPAVGPVRPCAGLVGDLETASGPAHVSSATEVAAGAQPAHCDVRGYLEPAVRFQLRLPTTTYTGRYVQYGCGGYCGVVLPPAFPDCGPDAGDAAVASTDDGHPGLGPIPSADATWGAGDRAARDDWAFRAPHALSVAAKQIIAAYYGAPPARSYFTGCSNGGREGLLLAQRYPHDFDGIIAGAPTLFQAPLAAYQAWRATANTGPGGAPILTADRLPALHRAVLAACDGLDGLVDGQLDDPRACRFDPGSLQCPDGLDAPSCLTPAQVQAARRLYAGPTDERGERLYPGWDTRGSELAWAQWLIPIPALGGSFAGIAADSYLRYLAYPIGAPPSSLAAFRFTASDFQRLTPEGIRANAMSLDLAAFRAAGGKLIIWQGWNDPAIPVIGTLDYYRRLALHDGGLAATQQWARLFLVPTMYHCTGGDRLTEFTPFRQLLDWVERGQAPDAVTATGRDSSGHPVRTRPVFPYPLRAGYTGTGSIDDASSFAPAPPLVPPDGDAIAWFGDYLYAIPGPVAP
jgi:hypothetical protein